jgi:hypothetical protein
MKRNASARAVFAAKPPLHTLRKQGISRVEVIVFAGCVKKFRLGTRAGASGRCAGVAQASGASK